MSGSRRQQHGATCAASSPRRRLGGGRHRGLGGARRVPPGAHGVRPAGRGCSPATRRHRRRSPWAGALVGPSDAARCSCRIVGQAAGRRCSRRRRRPPPSSSCPRLLGVGAAVAVPSLGRADGVITAAGDGSARANGRVETARYAGHTCCSTPALAGAVGRRRHELDAASFARVAVAAIGLSARRPAATAGGGPRPRARDGLALLVGDREVVGVTFVLVASLLPMSMTIAADVFFVRETLGQGAFGLGLLLLGLDGGDGRRLAGASRRALAHPPATVAIAAAAVQGAGKLGAATLGLVVPALACMPGAARRTASRTSGRARSCTSGCPRRRTGARSPPTPACATPPSSARPPRRPAGGGHRRARDPATIKTGSRARRWPPPAGRRGRARRARRCCAGRRRRRTRARAPPRAPARAGACAPRRS